MAPIRFVGRTAEGFQEASRVIVDATVFGVAALGKATGIGTFDYHPISKSGKLVKATETGKAWRCSRCASSRAPRRARPEAARSLL